MVGGKGGDSISKSLPTLRLAGGGGGGAGGRFHLEGLDGGSAQMLSLGNIFVGSGAAGLGLGGNGEPGTAGTVYTR